MARGSGAPMSMDKNELATVQKPVFSFTPEAASSSIPEAAASSISVALGVKESISAMGQEHKAFEGLLQGANDSGDGTVSLKKLTVSMIATIAVVSDKETRTYELKMTSGTDGGPLLEWHPKPNEGPINLVKTTRETTPSAVPQETLADALCTVMHDVKRKMKEVGAQQPKESKKAKKSNPQQRANK